MISIVERIERGEIEIPEVSLAEQADQILLAYLGQRDQLERLWPEVQKKHFAFPAHDYERRRAGLPILLAAYMTIRKLMEEEAAK
jgi:hypothetical protein